MLWKRHLWSPSYFMSTSTRVNVSPEIVAQYIESQLQRYNNGCLRR
ncbi:MAG: transposase [Lactobacillaceae bacterium]